MHKSKVIIDFIGGLPDILLQIKVMTVKRCEIKNVKSVISRNKIAKQGMWILSKYKFFLNLLLYNIRLQ